MANLTFYDSAQDVTGSAYLLETDHITILLECGLIQGGREEDELNRAPFPFDVRKLDAVVLSHAHLDHSGRLPKLVAEGYRGPIYMTNPTSELIEIMLSDAASLSLRDAQWENKRHRRSGEQEIQPLFTMEDVETTLQQCEGIDYSQPLEIAEGIELCFQDAGHILGSAIVELKITENGNCKKLVFSGDLGNSDTALLRDPVIVEEADILLLESTYGNRNHQPVKETIDEFENIIIKASEKGGNILIPSFAVGRAQELIFYLGMLYQKGKLKQQAVYLDSPMAIAATEIYHRYQDVFNREDSALLKQAKSGSLHKFLPVLRYSQTTEESIALNRLEGGAIIIAGSGMCNGGRIRHHFKHNIWRNNAHVIFVGFQAQGTPGRALVDGAKTYKMAGENIVVNAEIHTLGGFSAHASQSQLIDWVKGFRKKMPKIYLVHGEPETKEIFREKLKEQGWQVSIPEKLSTINI